ncbi:MAG: C4-dicarboxylate ABC transporter [Gammaproteobacteria bacterium]|nr:C4-dicarboxylate ABC transporter [Gammaproteobacteria bacterium]|tara:strand:+ start:259 stop:1416 length:1158 start_codon:yes stop_codon:yes gene_type:complete
MSSRVLSRLLTAALLLCFTKQAHSADPEFEPKFPRTMSWSAYNLGTTGYNQAVAIGKALKDNYNVNLRVLPGKNDVSRLLPLQRGRVQFSANGVATYFGQEGVFQFAGKIWGPLPLRLVMASHGDSNQALGVANDLGITSYADLRGKRVPYVRGAPALNVTTEAFLACGGLTWDDVQRVDFPGYNAMWTGIVNGQVDAAYATTVSGPTRKLEASPRGIFWPAAPHNDEGCWQRMANVVPFMQKHVATRGAAISEDNPHEGATYPYPMLITLAGQNEQLVHDLAKAIHIHYDEYKNADPGSIGWAMDRQNFQWVVPFHEGAVRYFKSIGVWSDAADAHNIRLIQRQSVLATAWQAHQAEDPEDFSATWMTRRAAALDAAGFDPIWR